MKHHNLVSLKGCCFRGEDRLLVYEYVENCDIEQTLLSKCNLKLFSSVVFFLYFN